MTVLILTLTAVVAVPAVTFGTQQLVSFVRGDGYRSRGADTPRSHPRDAFDPWGRRAA